MKNNKVLVVIVNYNSTNDLLELVSSIGNSKYKNYDILVIDNSSSESIESLRNLKLKLIENKENIGFTKAINHALMNFNYDYYWILNPDTIVVENTLQELMNVAEKYSAGFVGSAIYDYKTNKVYAMAGKRNFITGLAFPIKNINEIKELNGFDEYIDACSLLISRKVIEQVGYFDENYFMYLETEDFILRAKKQGFKTYVNPKAIVYHKMYGSSKGRKSKRTVYLLNKNRIYFMRKFSSKAKFYVFLTINFLVILPFQMLVYVIKGRFSLIPALVRGNFSL